MEKNPAQTCVVTAERRGSDFDDGWSEFSYKNDKHFSYRDGSSFGRTERPERRIPIWLRNWANEILCWILSLVSLIGTPGTISPSSSR